MGGNDNDPPGIDCEVIALKHDPESFLAEAINHGSDGEIYRAIFSGPDAQDRALAYAAWAYGHNGILMTQTFMHAPAPQKPRPVLTVVAVNHPAESGASSPSEASAGKDSA